MSVKQRIVVIVCIWALSVFTASAKTDIGGSYHCEGSDRDKAYRGWAEIARDGDIYNLVWTNEAGVVTGIGVGLRTQDVLSVVFQTGSGHVSIAAYAVRRGGVLDGIWLAGNATAPERLTPSKDPHPAPRMHDQHAAPDNPRIRAPGEL